MILNKHKQCEQVVFIKGWHKNILLIEMAGGEFCGNAIRAVMYYLSLKYSIKYAKIKYINYPFVVDCTCVNEISAFSVIVDRIVKEVRMIEQGVNKVVMDGITHYVIEKSSKYFKYNNNKTKTTKLIKRFTHDEKSVGIMYMQDFKIYPYVYVNAVNTLFYETACGSGTIACAMLYKNLKIITINQPSKYNLNVKFKGQKVFLSGKCKQIKQDYIVIGV